MQSVQFCHILFQQLVHKLHLYRVPIPPLALFVKEKYSNATSGGSWGATTRKVSHMTDRGGKYSSIVPSSFSMGTYYCLTVWESSAILIVFYSGRIVITRLDVFIQITYPENKLHGNTRCKWVISHTQGDCCKKRKKHIGRSGNPLIIYVTDMWVNC